jgi:hypothetical protein
MGVQRTGDWALARRLLGAGPTRLRSAIGTAIRQEAHALRTEIVRGLTEQAPGGEPVTPPAPLTLAARKLAGFGGTKALLVRGDLRNSIAVVVEGDEAFINLMAAVATFLNRNRWLELPRDPEDATLGTVRWEMDADGELRTQLQGKDDVRAFTWGLVVRGFDVDEGLPLDGGRPVIDPELQTVLLNGGPL